MSTDFARTVVSCDPQAFDTDRVRKHIKSGKTEPIYLLEGDDLQSRHDLALEFAAVVDEGLQAFNVESFYGNEATSVANRDNLLGALLSTARTLPMMAPRRVIFLHDAERILAPRRGKDEDEGQGELEVGAKKKKAITPVEELEAYFEKPEKMTTLVIVAAPLDANRRLVKLLRKKAVNVDYAGKSTGSCRLDSSAWKKTGSRSAEGDSALGATGLSLGRIRPEVEARLYVTGRRWLPPRVRGLVIRTTSPAR